MLIDDVGNSERKYKARKSNRKAFQDDTLGWDIIGNGDPFVDPSQRKLRRLQDQAEYTVKLNYHRKMWLDIEYELVNREKKP